MAKTFYYIDPESITSRIFGSIPTRTFSREGDSLTCTVTGKRWSLQEVDKAWYETRNLEGKND